MTNAEKFKDVFGISITHKKVTSDKWLEEEHKHKGVYECFNCGAESVIWDSDFDFSDFGYEGEGIVHICHCDNCGAEIEYRVPIPSEDEDGDTGEASEEHND